MGAPQVIMLVVMAVRLILAIVANTAAIAIKPADSAKFVAAIAGAIIGEAIWFLFLRWGGFF